MPVYQPRGVEYAIVSGRVSIVTDDGRKLPAYWSHPDMGGRFPAVAVIHDWWGITDIERHMAHLFAQMGYYVIIPDLFDGAVALTAQDALRLVEASAAGAYGAIDAALRVLETHVRCNEMVAAVGLGMGGSLALEAALTRTDLEASVALYGFPQKYLGRFHEAKAPILAIFAGADAYIGAGVIAQFRRELGQSVVDHQIVVIDEAAHGFFNTQAEGASAQAWEAVVAFLEKHLRSSQ